MNFKTRAPTLIAICALFGLLLGIIWILINQQEKPTLIPFQPPECPFDHCIAAVGCVQPLREEMWIGTPFAEIVHRIYVREGDYVLGGNPLFSLSTETLQAQKSLATATFELALSQYSRQLSLPREEDIPPFEAALRAAEAEFEDKLSHYFLYRDVPEPMAISIDELNQRKWAAEMAESRVQESRANLDLLLSGAWIKDLEVARANVIQAKRAIDAIELDIERSTVRAPCDGEILQININEGEYITGTFVFNDPIIRMGETKRLRLRVDVDEEEIWRVEKGARARAFLRGNSSLYFDLNFLRINPLVVPKKPLLNKTGERVDVRVLQVIYEFDRGDLPVFVGEVVDVYVEGKPHA